MKRCILGLGVSMAIAACQAPRDIGDSRAEVINGFRQTGAPEVVAVVRPMGLCSGTLIADYAVLTAKHCVFQEHEDGTHTASPPHSFWVYLGHDLTEADGVTDFAGVVDVWTTPGSDIDEDIENGDDVAVLLLAKTLSEDQRSVRTSPPVTSETVRMIGFGRIHPGEEREDDSGVKYEGSGWVSQVGARIVEVRGDSNVCQGDSGGPLVGDDGRIIGVASFGFGACHDSRSYYSRVDRHYNWIDDALTWEPPCDPEPERCGDGIDNDCNGVADEGCTALGDECAVADECADGQCEQVGSEWVCVRECDPRSAIPRCPFGFYCEATGCGEGRCIAGGQGPKEDGAECSADSECSSNSCQWVGDVRRCGRQCSPEMEPCASGLVCETLGDPCGSCIPVEISIGPRSFGAPCERNDQCSSQQCVDAICTRACGAGEPCPSGYHCRDALCVWGPLGGPGDPCLSSQDCGSNASDCVDADGEQVCAGECGSDESCTLGLECATTNLGERCLPPGLPLGAGCADHAECRSGICAGTCTRLCESSPCPLSFSCEQAGEHRGCFPSTDSHVDPIDPVSSGGCRTAALPRGSIVALLAFGILLVLRRRR